jgi:hypothetical protein
MFYDPLRIIQLTILLIFVAHVGAIEFIIIWNSEIKKFIFFYL